MKIFKILTYHLARMIITLIIIVTLSFLIIRAAPGSPLLARLAETDPASAERVERLLKDRYRLDEPLVIQWAAFVRRFASLDLTFFADGRPIWPAVRDALPNTILLNCLALTVIWGVALPLGAVTAVVPEGWASRIIGVFLLVLSCVPAFWAAQLLQAGVTDLSRPIWFPVMGMQSDDAERLTFWRRAVDLLHHLFLPVVTLSYGGIAYVARQVRSSLLNALAHPSIRSAQARGVAEWRVLWIHAMPNGLFPLITLLGGMLPYLVGGSVVVEAVFNLPGMGRLSFNGMIAREYDLVLGLLTSTSALTLICMTLCDFVYTMIDPRIRSGQGR